jgi:hypothetical protein
MNQVNYHAKIPPAAFLPASLRKNLTGEHAGRRIWRR